MSVQVCLGASLTCTFGAAPSSLVVARPTMLTTTPQANINDYKPLVNIMPFGVCSSLANPTVASATSAALGVLTPMPCIPATSAPWVPGKPTILVDSMPALDMNSKCMCSYGGVIQVVSPGQTKVVF